MKLLVLGGTRFLGRHIVDAALASGDDVTIFTRGRQPVPWSNVTALTGDRDPRIAPGLAALEVGTWDAVIDYSGYVPRIVEASAALVAPRVRRYLFVSSMSVYAKTERPGMDEATPLAALDDPGTEAVLEPRFDLVVVRPLRGKAGRAEGIAQRLRRAEKPSGLLVVAERGRQRRHAG